MLWIVRCTCCHARTDPCQSPQVQKFCGTKAICTLQDLDLPALFAAVEGARGELGIEEYSISQTTLEHVFVALAQLSSAPVEEAAGMTALPRCSAVPASNAGLR